jgi:glycosyltransferase involved in cell wall biosynthesis
MNDQPKMSVCVITYNQEAYIRKCLQSIVDQTTNFKFEIIVGDDCSVDGTQVILHEFSLRYPNLIKIIYQEKNIGGGTNNYLTVHRAARGLYVCHVDGDDWLRQNKLQAQCDYLDSYLDVTMVAHRMGIWKEDKLIGTTMRSTEFIDINLLLKKHPIFLHSSIAYRKEKISKLFEGYNEFIDFYLYVTAASIGKIGFINQVLGDYRAFVGLSNSRKSLPYIMDAINLASKTVGETDLVVRCRSRHYLSYGMADIIANDCISSKKNIRLSMTSEPNWILPKIIYLFTFFPLAFKLSLKAYKFIKLKINQG